MHTHASAILSNKFDESLLLLKMNPGTREVLLAHFRWNFLLERANMSSPDRPAETISLPSWEKLPCVSHPPKEILRTQKTTS